MSPSEIQFGSVALESKLNDFVLDIILYKNGTPLIVEVYVTHKVDEYKLQKIKKSGISAIEINLSKLDRDIIYSESMLKDIVVKSTEEKRWLFNRKYN